MLKPRYSRRREAREKSDGDEEAQLSDHASISGDLAESSDASSGSEDDEGNSSGGEDETSSPLKSRYEQRQKKFSKDSEKHSGTVEGWGSPPKTIDKDITWEGSKDEAAAAANPENTMSWADNSSNLEETSVDNWNVASTPESTSDGGRGNVPQRGDATVENTRDSWSQSSGARDRNENWGRQNKVRGKANVPSRGRGSAPKPGRGNRGGQRGGARPDFPDRPSFQTSRGGKRGSFQGRPSGDRGFRGSQANSSMEPLRDQQLPSATETTNWTDTQLEGSKSNSQSEVNAEDGITWGNAKEKKENQQDTSASTEAQENDKGARASDRYKNRSGGNTPRTANASDNWKKSDKQGEDDEWIDKTAGLELSDSKPNNNGEEGFKRNTVHQRRLEARREYRKKLEEDPSFVPHLGEFWSHDDRFRDDEMKNNANDRRRDSPRGRGRGRGGRIVTELVDQPPVAPAPGPPQKWTHDGYESLLKMEEREEQSRRSKSEQMEQRGEYGQSQFAGDRGFGRQRGRGRGFRGGRGRSDQFGRITRDTPASTSLENDSTKTLPRQSKPESVSSKPAIAMEALADEDQESATASLANATTSNNAEEDSDVEIILETPQWQTEQVLGIPTPKSIGSEKSLTGDEQTGAGISQEGGANEKLKKVGSPSTKWDKSNSRSSPNTSNWQQHDDQQEYSQEHPYPPHTMLSPNAMQFVPMTTMGGGSSSNMMPMQAMYAVPMPMSGNREGMPGPIMYAPVMNSQQGMFEANGMFYYNYDANQVPMYTPVMYYPQSQMPAENERVYQPSPKWGYSRKYTQQDRSRGKHNSPGPQ
jgi:CASC3/Barentsz eIF4AIII binding